MTTKKTQTTTREKKVPEDLQLAQEIHTLVHRIRGRIAPAHPAFTWQGGFPAAEHLSEPLLWPPTPYADVPSYRGDLGPWNR